MNRPLCSLSCAFCLSLILESGKRFLPPSLLSTSFPSSLLFPFSFFSVVSSPYSSSLLSSESLLFSPIFLLLLPSSFLLFLLLFSSLAFFFLLLILLLLLLLPLPSFFSPLALPYFL